MTGRARRRSRYSPKRFQRQVVVFFVGTVVVLLGVLYLSLARATIRVTPLRMTDELSLTFNVAPEVRDDASDALVGTVLQVDEDVTSVFEGGTATAEVTGRAGGTVTLYNTSDRAQPLVAGTRLLSETGILFRTVEPTEVPAQGNIDVPVLADDEGHQGDIAPSRFEVVALWESRKDQIYGESAAPMSGGVQTLSIVSQEDINTAQQSVLNEVTTRARIGLEAQLLEEEPTTGMSIITTSLEFIQQEVSATPGDEVDAFTYRIAARITGIAVAHEAYAQLIEEAAAEQLTAGALYLGSEDDVIEGTIRDVDVEARSATVTVRPTVTYSITLESPLFDKSVLLGMSKDDIRAHFGQFDEIADVAVTFSPFWVTHAPQLPDHVDIILEEAAS